MDQRPQMPAALLHSALNEKLATLAGRARWWRFLRGCGWLSLTVNCGALVAIGLDSVFDLSAWLRSVLLLGWLCGCGLVTWLHVVQPWRDHVPLYDIAESIERDFPGLSERLTTLAERTEPGNGSNDLIGVLARETDQRTRRLDFDRGVPVRRSIQVFSFGITLLVLGLFALTLTPGAGEQVRRVVLPWHRPANDLAFQIVVASGDPVVSRGDPVTLSAYLEPTRACAKLPDAATLVLRNSATQPDLILPMTGTAGAGFHLTIPGATNDLEYRVMAGGVHSDWHRILADDPVTLAANTTLTTHPPRYAESVVSTQKLEGFPDFEILQYGRAVLDLKFSQAPSEVYLNWRTSHPTDWIRYPVRLSDDRLSGSAEVSIPSDGTLVLVLIGSRGVRTDIPAAVRAIPDSAPRFEKVVGLSSTVREVRPNEQVPINLTAEDDLQIQSLQIEYCLTDNAMDVRTVPIRVPGIGSRRVEGAMSFGLTGKVKEGDTLRFRISATDNRLVGEHKLGPQDAVFPHSGWTVLRVTSSARPLIEQEVLGQRDRIRNQLDRVAELTRSIARDVGVVRDASFADGVLTVDQAVRLRRSREAAAEAGARLGELAAEAALHPALKSFAGAVRELTGGPFHSAAEAIRTAESITIKNDRYRSLETAVDQLSESQSRLAELTTRNEKTAQARLDRHTLRQIATDQLELAGRTGRQQSVPDELVKRQRDLQARLNQAIATSEVLKESLDTAAGELLHELLDRARKLADDQNQLDRAISETELAARRNLTDELARLQRELASDAARFAAKTATASRLAVISPLDRKPFDEARDLLSRGDPDQALTEQERAALELDRLAAGLARAAESRRDLKDAARQLSRWQDDLRRRVADAVSQSHGNKLPDELRKQLVREQTALSNAARLIQRPNASTELAQKERSAVEAATNAARALAGATPGAAEALQRAATALAALADQMPDLQTRLKQAPSQLDAIQTDQGSIARDANDAVREADQDAVGRKLDAVAGSQRAIADRIRKLDLPGLERLQAQAALAADRAEADLRAGLLSDVELSQREVRRQLEGLKNALDGVPSPDVEAQELVRLQRSICESLGELLTRAATDKQEQILRLQQEVARRIESLTDPNIPYALDEAKHDVRNAVETLRKFESIDKLRDNSQVALDTLMRLAVRLSGAESDLDQAERLMRERTAAVGAMKQFERRAADPDAEATRKRRLLRQIEELNQMRAGKAQDARRKAVEALTRLKETSNSDKLLGRQYAAIEALRTLVDEMTRQGDRTLLREVIGPPKPTVADDLQRLSYNGTLPGRRDSEAANELARRQRDLRDATSRAAVGFARGVRAAEGDILGKLAGEQQQLADAVSSIELPAMEDGRRRIEKAIQHARNAARSLRVGSLAAALSATKDAEATLRPLASKKAQELATRQAAVTTTLEKHAGDLEAAASRHHHRQSELATEAALLSERLRDAAGDKPDTPLRQAVSAIDDAGRQMTQAKNNAVAGRSRQANNARQLVARSLAKAVAQTAAAAGPPREKSPRHQPVLDLGSTVQRAGEQMRCAEIHLHQTESMATTTEHMKQAADVLSQAVRIIDMMLGENTPDRHCWPRRSYPTHPPTR